MNGSEGNESLRATNEPRDHEIEATSITSRPTAVAPPSEPVRPDHERESDEADHGGEHGRAGDALAGDGPPDHDLERHRAGDHRRDARVDARLGDVDEADSEREERDAQARGRQRFPPRDAERAPEQRENAGEDERRRRGTASRP